MRISPQPPAKRRVLHVGDHGRDVLAAQRAARKLLRKHGLVSTNRATGLYGQGTLKDVLRIQHLEGIQTSGRVGTLTWQALDPELDLYGRFLLTLKPKPPTPAGQRVEHEMEVLLALAPRAYTQARPAATTVAGWKADGGDCSGTAYLARFVSGVLPEWNGFGNTGTLWASGSDVSETGLQAGDHILYGSNGVTHHVAVYDGHGQGIGMGSPGGPRRLPVRYRLDVMGFRRYW